MNNKQRLDQQKNRLKSALVASAGSLLAVDKSPDELLGELFSDVQTSQVYSDGKTFVDLIPRKRAHSIKQEYELAKQDPHFDLREFVSRHFYEFSPQEDNPVPLDVNIDEHIQLLWRQLRRKNRLDRGSLLAVPHHYTVPGGRFSEQFYWDSYFIMLGLAADNRWGDVEGMLRNYAYMIRRFGRIPTANRSYFLSRSQPPFFSHMVKLLAKHKGNRLTLVEYLPYMLAEYRFWMKGSAKLRKDSDHVAYSRVIKMPNGAILNRYYDDKKTPRPESMREDVETAGNDVDAEDLYLHLRAGAESGWDFSSRWFKSPGDIHTIHTTDIVPVDLNCLLYQLESTIAQTYRLIKQPLLSKRFERLASRRSEAILQYCWDDGTQFFYDYDYVDNKVTNHVTLAAAFPLYAQICTSAQAKVVAQRLEEKFLMKGGLVTTLQYTGQQWDYPNGWAPLQWVAIHGLRNYGYHDLASEVRSRWLSVNQKVFDNSRKLIEKYNVVDEGGIGGGGEYPLQDGFGWTNGVYAALKSE